VFGGDDLRQHTCGGRRDLSVDLVGGDLEQRLILLHRVTLLLEPAGDSAFGDPLTECGHLNGDGHVFRLPRSLERSVSSYRLECRLPSCHVSLRSSPQTCGLEALALSIEVRK